MQAIVADRGQVTIPQTLRRRLGIQPRTVLDFHEERGRLVAVKVPSHDPVREVMGCVKTDRRVDDLMRDLRGER